MRHDEPKKLFPRKETKKIKRAETHPITASTDDKHCRTDKFWLSYTVLFASFVLRNFATKKLKQKQKDEPQETAEETDEGTAEQTDEETAEEKDDETAEEELLKKLTKKLLNKLLKKLLNETAEEELLKKRTRNC